MRRLRITEHDWHPFAATLCAREDVETAGIILAEAFADGDVLIARELHPIPDDGYLIRRRDQLRIDPIALNRVLRRARELGLAAFTVHTHPGTHEPWFSAADDAGDERLMPSFYAQMPGPHGSLVIAAETGAVAGRVWTPTTGVESIRIVIVGRRLGVFDGGRERLAHDAVFDRQRLALGEHGQAVTRSIHAAVVGLGGSGSVVAVQLAHLGLEEISAVDRDLVEISNVSRIVGATRGDAGVTAKVDVAERYASTVGLGGVRAIRGRLGVEVSAAQLLRCDVIFSCVDRHAPRAALNRLAYEALVPVIDMGSAFRVDDAGEIVGSAGRVVVVGPGRPCLACWGHIDAHRLRVEALPPDARGREVADGYIEGAEVPQPAVVAFNTAIAGAAVVEFLRLVTGFAGADDPPDRLAFDFGAGTVRRGRLAQRLPCKICSGRGVPEAAPPGHGDFSG